MTSKRQTKPKIDNTVFPVFMLEQHYFETKDKKSGEKISNENKREKLIELFAAMTWNG